MVGTPVNQLDYVDYDFADLVDQLNTVLQASNTWRDVLASSTGETLIEFYAYVANMILYYVERTAEEMYIQTAQRKSSVVNLVSLLNYTPYRSVSAIGSVTFTLSEAHATQVFIPAQTTLLQTTGGLYYSVSQSSVIAIGQTSLTVPVIQGEWFTNTYTSAGGSNQSYDISNTEVENENLTVSVNGVLWTPVTTFIEAVATSQVYQIIANLDDTLTILFGDGIAGMEPGSGEQIIISFLQSDGTSGNVYSTGVINRLISTIYDSDGEEVTNLTVSNPTSVIGGTDAETVEQIRVNGPQVFSTGQRAITRSDFLAILGNYPSVASSNVWGENDLNPPNYDAFNTIYISTVLQDWQLPTTEFNQTLGDTLYDYSSLTVKYSFVAPQIVQVMPYVSIYVQSSYSLSAVQSAVGTAFEDAFELGVTSKLGQNVRYASVITTIQAVPGVSYVYLALNVYQPLTYSFTSTYDFGIVAPLLDMVAGTVKLYKGTLQIGVDNGAGGWTAIASGYSLGGNLNYTTGAVNVDITPTQASNADIYIAYEQDENGDLVVDLDQILEYFDMNVPVLAYS